MNKDEVAAPIVMLELILITAAIGAKKWRNVAVMDLPGTSFVHQMMMMLL